MFFRFGFSSLLSKILAKSRQRESPVFVRFGFSSLLSKVLARLEAYRDHFCSFRSVRQLHMVLLSSRSKRIEDSMTRLANTVETSNAVVCEDGNHAMQQLAVTQADDLPNELLESDFGH